MADQTIQRRLEAILAADVVGYSALMEADEDATITAWKAARTVVIDPKISEHNGRIVKHTGDGFLAEFGAVSDAVTCAVMMQRALADQALDFRMGVNLGDIVDELDDIHGDGVNIAARLEGIADAGGICISGSVYDQVRKTLDYVFADMGEQTVKNIVTPVRAYKLLLEDIAANWATRDDDRPSIAVLPFDNLSGDPEQEYFSDGMAEDLITDLSKISNLFVTARNSSFSFKGQRPDVRDVAEKLGVAYVLEGSVRKMGERLRINAQLIEAMDGGHL